MLDFIKIGMTAVEVLVKILENYPEIETVSFYVYKPHLNAGEASEIPTTERLLFHDSPSDVVDVSREDITVENLNHSISHLSRNETLAVLSSVKKGDELYHIPMMDFSCQESPEGLAKIETFLKEIRYENCAILTSGRSYHFYGFCLINEKDWLRFLGDCLLSGLVEARYIGHRLRDSNTMGILRLSACPLRPKVPTVVSIL